MDEDTPQPEPEKPRFLLPDGCKDLIDALRLRQQHTSEGDLEIDFPGPSVSAPPTPPPLGFPANVTIPDPVTVGDLASALHLKPFQLIHSLMQFNIFAAPGTQLEFNTASVICAQHGVTAHKVA